uniref:Uncharacterized protein n=1 Tax=Plectus sambesii TaxID=2011161 RepID=A0A914W2K0_9BILA
MARRGMPATHVWLCELGSAVEMECTSILHAKSLLDLGLGTADATPPQPPPPVCDKRTKTVDDCKTPELVLGSGKLPDQPNASSSPLSSGDSGMCSCHDSVLSGRNADGDRSSVDSACGSSQNSAKETFTDVYHRQSGLAANLKSGISFLPAYADLTGKK